MGEREGREEEGGGKGEKGKGRRREGKGESGNGRDGTGHGMGRGRERRKGREKEERGYSPQTSIPSATTGPKSRTERPRKTKIGKEVAHVTRDSYTTFKVTRPLYSPRRLRIIRQLQR